MARASPTPTTAHTTKHIRQIALATRTQQQTTKGATHAAPPKQPQNVDEQQQSNEKDWEIEKPHRKNPHEDTKLRAPPQKLPRSECRLGLYDRDDPLPALSTDTPSLSLSSSSSSSFSSSVSS